MNFIELEFQCKTSIKIQSDSLNEIESIVLTFLFFKQFLNIIAFLHKFQQLNTSTF
jgi:hypothetical protein